MTEATTHRSKRVLIVDDNPDVRSSMKLALEHAGFEVETAPDGSKALESQRSHPADVLITDLFMPEPDGFETIRRFRKAFPDVKIVAVSGGGSATAPRADHLFVAEAAGADATLRKPFAIESLLETLREI